MNKIDWKSKLTSRKFWLAVVSLVTAILVVFNVPELTVEQVTTIIMAFATVIAYIIGEGLVDSSRINSGTTDNSDQESEGEE